MAITYGPNLGLIVNATKGEDFYADFQKLLRGLDALVQPRILDKDLATPPGSPADGDCYIVAGSPTGLWTGHATKITRWSSVASAWEFYTPKEGWRVYVVDENLDYQFDGAAWV